MSEATAAASNVAGLGRLGYAGLIPFAVLAVAPGVNPAWQPVAGQALTVYSVAVLSFIGAVAWGLVLMRPTWPEARRRALAVWGVAPSLLATVAALAPAPERFGLFLATLWLAWWAERRLYPLNELPQAWLTLRLRLSAGVSVCWLLAWPLHRVAA
jgi:hypothetical protein